METIFPEFKITKHREENSFKITIESTVKRGLFRKSIPISKSLLFGSQELKKYRINYFHSQEVALIQEFVKEAYQLAK